jgi:hypothetical protein
MLTVEVFGTYFRHLAPGGVLAVHVSNRYLDLYPVVAAAASAWQRDAVQVVTAPEAAQATSEAHWVFVTRDPSELGEVVLRAAAAHPTPRRDVPAWTDDYGNLFQVLR